MLRTSRPFARRVALAAAVLLAATGLTAVVPTSAALAHPEICTGDHDDGHDHDHGDSEICFTDEEIAQMDDSGATLPVDQIAKSDNVRHLANVPKQGGFEPEGAFNSDLAFTGHYVIDGNYNGFTIYDIRNPRKPTVVTVFSCPGSQNDVSVHGNLLITSTDSSRNKAECEGNVAAPAIGEGVVGRHPDLRHLEPGGAAVRQGRRDRLRFAHAHDHPGPPPPPRAGLRVVLQPGRVAARLPAAARQDLDRRDPGPGAAGCPRHLHPRALPGRRLPRRAR